MGYIDELVGASSVDRDKVMARMQHGTEWSNLSKHEKRLLRSGYYVTLDPETRMTLGGSEPVTVSRTVYARKSDVLFVDHLEALAEIVKKDEPRKDILR
jgi:hypothetical protein